MYKTKSRVIKLKVVKYCILDGHLYWKNLGGMLLTCLLEIEVEEVINEFYKGDCGGHLHWKVTMNKILRASLYWHNIFSNVHRKVNACHECKIFEGKRKSTPFPLKPISVMEPFQQWGLDFIGEINPTSLGQNRWILATTYYFTKWVDAMPTRLENENVVIQFLKTNIFSRFGCPRNVIIDNAPAFK